MDDAGTALRPFEDQDEAAVVEVWHRSGKAAYPFLLRWQALTLERATQGFRELIRLAAISGSAPAGSLVLMAKTPHPDGLELHTHQENHAARRLYERHGFRVVRFGTSPPPESAPDVECHWRPVKAGSEAV